MFFTNSYSSHVKRLFVHKICEEIICSRNPWRDYLFTKSVKRLFVHDICHVCHSSLILFSRCFRTCNSNDKKKTKEERPRTVVGHRVWKQGRESEQKIKGHTIPQPHLSCWFLHPCFLTGNSRCITLSEKILPTCRKPNWLGICKWGVKRIICRFSWGGTVRTTVSKSI